ncbi:MAG: RHS repeat-associated core domain-containing protein, partial [Dolichospermum sp.]
LYNYDAYGTLLNSTGSSENSYRFVGEQFDKDLNQYYLRDRYYNQGIGRFTRSDSYQGNISSPGATST